MKKVATAVQLALAGSVALTSANVIAQDAATESADVEKIQVWLDDVQICKDGGAAADYTEAEGARVMSQAEMTIRVDLGRGAAKDTVYTCDLSYDYVKINADYRS